jgi:hypothetical protein
MNNGYGLSWGCETEFFAFPVGQSCCSALKSWAARQRRPTMEVKIFVVRPSKAGAFPESCKFGGMGFHCAMQTLERIEEEVKRLSKAEQESLRDWLENMLEDDLGFTDEFKAKMERGEQDIRAGRVRIRKS